MEGARDYRSSWKDRTYNTMTTDDGELTNSYPENNQDGNVANVDEYLKRGHIPNRLLGIIRLTSAHDTLVDIAIYCLILNLMNQSFLTVRVSNSRGVSTWYYSMYCYVVFTYVTEYRILVYVCRQGLFFMIDLTT